MVAMTGSRSCTELGSTGQTSLPRQQGSLVWASWILNLTSHHPAQQMSRAGVGGPHSAHHVWLLDINSHTCTHPRPCRRTLEFQTQPPSHPGVLSTAPPHPLINTPRPLHGPKAANTADQWVQLCTQLLGCERQPPTEASTQLAFLAVQPPPSSPRPQAAWPGPHRSWSPGPSLPDKHPDDMRNLCTTYIIYVLCRSHRRSSLSALAWLAGLWV